MRRARPEARRPSCPPRAALAQPPLPCVRRRKIHGAGHDQAILSLQLDADLRSVFNWNVKQLFVYITAEYETDANVSGRRTRAARCRRGCAAG